MLDEVEGRGWLTSAREMTWPLSACSCVTVGLPVDGPPAAPGPEDASVAAAVVAVVAAVVVAPDEPDDVVVAVSLLGVGQGGLG